MQNDSIPYLTIIDKENAINMGDDDVPALIVEGKTDIMIYRKLLSFSRKNWTHVDFVVGKSKTNILNFCKKKGCLFKYLCILDSDFDFYNNSEQYDTRIVYTHFYTVENFLCEYKVVEKTYHDLSVLGDPTNFYEIFKNIIESIKPFALSSFMKNIHDWNIELENCSIRKVQWGDYSNNLTLTTKCMEEYILKELEKNNIICPKMDWEEANNKFNTALNKYDYNNLVKGKQIIEAIYLFFKHTIPTQMNKIHEDAFKVSLCKNIDLSSGASLLLQDLDRRFATIFNNYSFI